MPNVPGTNLVVEGYQPKDLIKQLKYYSDRVLDAKFHLVRAGRSGLKIFLFLLGEKARFKKGVVEISWDACDSLHLKGCAPRINCIAETALFELQNGINSNRYDALKTKLDAGEITLLQYGLRFARTEAKSTITTAKIIRQLETLPPSYVRASYVPSAWGLAQRSAYFGCSGSFEDYFANQPHELNPDMKKFGDRHLKSKFHPAFEVKVVKETTFKNITKTVASPPGKRVEWYDVYDEISTFQAKNNLTDREAFFFYVLTLDLLKRKNWVVNWNEETPGDWIAYTDDLILNGVMRKEHVKIKKLEEMLSALAK